MALRAEAGTGAEGHPAPSQERGRRILAEAERPAVEPGEEARFWRHVAHARQVVAEEPRRWQMSAAVISCCRDQTRPVGLSGLHSR